MCTDLKTARCSFCVYIAAVWSLTSAVHVNIKQSRLLRLLRSSHSSSVQEGRAAAWLNAVQAAGSVTTDVLDTTLGLVFVK